MDPQQITFEGHHVPLPVEVSITHFCFLPDEADLIIWLPNGGILAHLPLTEEMATQLFNADYLPEDMFAAIMATYTVLKATPIN